LAATHQDLDNAPSDGANMIRIDTLPGIVKTLLAIDAIAEAKPVVI